MNKLFYFYPHCFLKSTNKEILVYDTLSQRHVYLKNNPLSKEDRKSFRIGFVNVSESVNDFVNLCFSKELGYFVDFEKVSPLIYGRELNFVSSIHKEREALGYNLQSNTNLLLREVTILLNNGKDDYADELCLQMDYPKCNNESIKLDYFLQQLSPFQYLENIILAGEIELSELEDTLEYMQKYNVDVIHRVMFNSFNNVIELKLLDRFDKFSVELLVDNSVDMAQARFFLRDKVYLKAIIKTLSDVDFFSGFKDVFYLPILFPERYNIDVLTQMILSEDEILHSSKSVMDCNMSDYVNHNIFGHITIDHTGIVSVWGKRIASIFEYDLPSIINRWVGQDDCTWYKTRNKKYTCKECALQCLCPSISIYEEMGLYKSACSI